MRGRCLCDSVEFEVHEPPSKLYQCHCSLCRRQSGTASNAAWIVRAAQLQWLSGEGLIRSYVRPTGFRSDFCGRCGSPLPNPLRDTSWVWVPVGLMEVSGPLEVALHLFVGSRALWEPAPQTGNSCEAMPDFAQLLKGLRSPAGRSGLVQAD